MLSPLGELSGTINLDYPVEGWQLDETETDLGSAITVPPGEYSLASRVRYNAPGKSPIAMVLALIAGGETRYLIREADTGLFSDA